MKVLVTHVYSSHNKGDAALLSVVLKELKNKFGSPEIEILTIDKITENEIFEGSRVSNSFMYFAISGRGSQLSKMLGPFFVVVSTLVWATLYKFFRVNFPLPKSLKRIAGLYRDADLIMPVGGGYMRGTSGIASTVGVALMLHPLVVASILGKPTIMYSQSVGPFANKAQKVMASFVLKRVAGIAVREDTSLKLLREIGVSNNVIRAIDGGFLFTDKGTLNLRDTLRIKSGQIFVGVTVRQWLSGKAQHAYEKAVAESLDYITGHYDASVVFIAQVTSSHHKDDDREASQRVYNLMVRKESAHVMKEDFDHFTILAACSGLDYLIGTRFHSVIFALNNGVPAIAIEYEHKTSGIMRDLGLSEWVLKIEDVTTKNLSALFDRLIRENTKYRELLKEVMPRYIRKGNVTMDFIAQTYQRHLKSQ